MVGGAAVRTAAEGWLNAAAADLAGASAVGAGVVPSRFVQAKLANSAAEARVVMIT